MNIKANTDCGTKKTVKIKMTKNNYKCFLYRYIIEDEKLVCITPKIISNYIGKEVDVRTPTMCENKDICDICLGELLTELRRERELDERFSSIMKSHGKEKCPSCNKIIDRGDVSWNNPSTEAGTPMTVVEIQCQKCDTEIIHGTSWQPSAKDFEEFVDEVLEDIFE